MVKLIFYEDEREIEIIPEKYSEFTQLLGNLFGLQEIDIFIFEYTLDDKEYILLNQGTYNNFYKEYQNAKVYIYPCYEESNHYKQNNKKEEEEIEKEDNNNIEIKEEAYENDNNINISYFNFI